MPVVLVNKRGLLVVARAYFGIPAPIPKCDILYVRHVAKPMGGKGWKNTCVQNVLVDLAQPAGDRWNRLDKGTRYEIRRAQASDSVQTELHVNPGPDEIARFMAFYNSFAARKVLPPAKTEHLAALERHGALCISWVRGNQGPIVSHQYMVGDGRARLVLSCGASASDDAGFRQRLGRANRLLHWQDMQTLSGQGVGCYDFGGVYLKSDQPELSKIARFKMGFGGTLVNEYKCMRLLTLRGRVMAWGWRWLESLRGPVRRLSALKQKQT